MNHIYRLVWSTSHKALVAVSELTSSKRRAGSSGTIRAGKSTRLLSAALVGASSLIYAVGVQAQSTGDVKLDNLQSLVSKYGAPVQVPVAADQSSVGAVVGAPARRVLSGVTDAVSGVPVVGPVAHQAGGVVNAVVAVVPAAVAPSRPMANTAPVSSRARVLGIADSNPVSSLPVVGPVVGKVGDALGAVTSGQGNPGGALHGVVGGVVDATSSLPVVGPVVGKVGDALGAVTSGQGNPGGALHGVVGGVVDATSKLPVVGPVVGKVGDALGVASSGQQGHPGDSANGLADLGDALGKVVGGVVNTAAKLPVAGPTVASMGETLKTATSGGNLGIGLQGQAGQVVGHAVDTLARTPGVGPLVADVGSLLEKTTADIGNDHANGGADGVSGLVNGLVDATSGVPVVGPVVGKVGDALSSVTSGTGAAGGAVNGVVKSLVDATSGVPVVGPVVGKVGDALSSVTSGTGAAGGAVNGVVKSLVDATSGVPVVGPVVGKVGGALSSVTSGTGAAGGAVNGVVNNLVDATSGVPVVGPIVGQVGQTLSSVTSGVGGLGHAPASPLPAAAIAPMAVPVVPLASTTPSGLIVSNGGVVGTVNQLLGTTESALFTNSDPNGYVTSGGLQVSNANFSQGYSTVNLLGLPVLNATPVGTVLTAVDGTVLGSTGASSHLTLVGAVRSGNYINNINNGAASGLLGLVLPNGAPAWASSCMNVLGVLTESCWAVNAAQDRQVLVGDGASANGSNEVVIGTGASHTLPTVDACTAFPGGGRNDANNPCGLPTADYATRLGHSVVIGDGATGTADGQTVLGAGASASATNSVALGRESVADRGAQTGYTAYGLATPQNSAGEVSIGAPGQERQITNVAAGSADTDAVNVAQLRSVQSTADNSVQYDDPSKATVTLAGTASVDGGKTDGTGISNLHQGTLSADSTDAVNGSQIWHWTQDTNNIYSNYSLYNSIKNLPGPSTGSIKYFSVNSVLDNSNASGENAIAIGPEANASGTDSVALGNGATATVGGTVALGAGSVADRADTVSVGSSGHERQIANVAAGTETTDAANVGQVQQAVNWANAYTDQRFNYFNQQLDRVGRNANAGIAGAMAMAGLPQAYLPGKSMVAVAAGTFRGESSLAIGISTISEGGRWVYKLTGSTNTRGDAGVTIGAGLQW